MILRFRVNDKQFLVKGKLTIIKHRFFLATIILKTNKICWKKATLIFKMMNLEYEIFNF